MSKEKLPTPDKETVDHVEQIIKTLEANKKKLAIVPSTALDIEIINAGKSQGYDKYMVKACINELAKNKRVAYGRTLNHKWFRSINNQNS